MNVFRVSFAAAILAALLAGCSQPVNQTSQTTPGNSTSATSTTPTSPSTEVAKNEAKTSAPTNGSGSPNAAAPGQPTSPNSKGAPSSAHPSSKPGVTGDETWHESKESPTKIAKEADDMLASLKNVKGDIDYQLEIPAGHTQGKLVEEIRDDKTFFLQYPVLASEARYGVSPTVSIARSDGKRLSETVNDVTTSRQTGARSKAPSNLVNDFPVLANREVFAGYLDSRKPFSDLISALLDKTSGYGVAVKERTLQYQGKALPQYMIIATRSGPQAATLGTSELNFIFDGSLHLPVTIRAMARKPGQTTDTYVSWSAKWTNNVRFKDIDFVPLRPGTASTKKS